MLATLAAGLIILHRPGIIVWGTPMNYKELRNDAATLHKTAYFH